MSRRELDDFEAVFLPHLDDAYTLARHLTGNDHDAQDVVQEAALRALRHLSTFRNENARAWVLTIVRNCAHSWRRKHRVDSRMVEYDDRDHGLAENRFEATDRATETDSEAVALRRAIAELPPEFREVIVLREIEELSYKEIAVITGVPIGTVMSRLARGRARLQRALGIGMREAR